MSDSEVDDTHISFKSISKGIEDVLEFKLQVDTTLKNFSDSVNSLSASITLYNKQLRTQHVNDSDHNYNNGKKKFCNNNDDDDDNNNSKSKKPYKICPYRETDPKGKKEYLKGKTLLEKHKYLLNYETQLVIELEAKEKKRKQKENKNLEVNMNDRPHLHPVIIDQPESTSCSSSDINSTNTHLIIDPTSSPIIPAPTSNNTTITVRSSKPLPQIIDSDHPDIKWTKVPKEKIKRKRDDVKPSINPSIIYTLESEDYNKLSTSVNKNNDLVDDATDSPATDSNASESDADPGAFPSNNNN
jgi:hypothetical protein